MTARLAKNPRKTDSVRSIYAEYFARIEQLGEGSEYKEFYLWPRTPLGDDHQQVIAKRVGVSDREVQDPRSRPGMIIQLILDLQRRGVIGEDFSVLDIACGDALVLWQVKKRFPDSSCYGVDCNKGVFATHALVEADGVKLYSGYIQHLFHNNVHKKSPFDLVLMLNTYRGWQHADLREHERFLPQMADTWFERNARYVVLTASPPQIPKLRERGFRIKKLGKGEDKSVMLVCSAIAPLPGSFFFLREGRVGTFVRDATELPRWMVRNTKLFGVRDSLFAASKLCAAVAGRRAPFQALSDGETRDTFLAGVWPVRPVEKDTTYVFSFLGEFGYELLNWQGVVRKFAEQLPPSSEIVIAGRKGLQPFYEKASRYIEISDLPAYQESYAAAYFAQSPNLFRRRRPPTPEQIDHDQAVRNEIESRVRSTLSLPGRKLRFVFSSQLTAFPGCVFGVDPRYYGGPGEHPGSIYAKLDLENNRHRKIEPDPSARAEIEKQVGFSLEKPYVLMQLRKRAIGPQSGCPLDEKLLIDELSRHAPIVLLSFNTGRYLDSTSNAQETGKATVVNLGSFVEQSCLIAYAHRCVFLSEGDLGSHTYLPPLMGKNVVIVASKEIFERPSAPIDLWNEKVFRFGGQMIPWPWERVAETKESLRARVDALFDGGS